MDSSEIIKDLQIIIVLSPFFLVVFSLGFLLQKGFKSASTHSISWLTISVVMGAVFLYQLFNRVDFYRLFFTLFVVSSGVSTYLSLKAKGR